MLSGQLKGDLLQIEAETFEIIDLAGTAHDLATAPVDDLVVLDPDTALAACSSSCSCSSCCSCSTSSCCSTSTSTSSCG